jgi:hypothetical protein
VDPWKLLGSWEELFLSVERFVSEVLVLLEVVMMVYHWV